ncbi:hypothetical protein [Fibrobacter sp. UWEL]|uniref:hypothetical protein n=1 Tax=Fibrobacter sp. UWEL TaxID=1896209 RepID=UPI00091240F4|nr:hypothetical protein [Fibrobacter sp. UWEL]SHL50645.1 hypothetical protein SAMN05720468_1369 [Fibrobacter sp. UWEL]
MIPCYRSQGTIETVVNEIRETVAKQNASLDPSTTPLQGSAQDDISRTSSRATNMRTYMVFSHHKMPPYKAEPMLGDFLMRHYYGQDSQGNQTGDTVIVDTLRSIGKTNFFKYRLQSR